jgi:hypothetical protein
LQRWRAARRCSSRTVGGGRYLFGYLAWHGRQAIADHLQAVLRQRQGSDARIAAREVLFHFGCTWPVEQAQTVSQQQLFVWAFVCNRFVHFSAPRLGSRGKAANPPR